MTEPGDLETLGFFGSSCKVFGCRRFLLPVGGGATVARLTHPTPYAGCPPGVSGRGGRPLAGASGRRTRLFDDLLDQARIGPVEGLPIPVRAFSIPARATTNGHTYRNPDPSSKEHSMFASSLFLRETFPTARRDLEHVGVPPGPRLNASKIAACCRPSSSPRWPTARATPPS